MQLKKMLVEHIRTIHHGTFNFNEYRRTELKSINLLFTTLDYIAQLPYLRLVTAPVIVLGGIPLFVLWVLWQIIMETLSDMSYR